ncbi:MAG: bifunctional phosphopantothenoylcysteine decarboxylase/phosphopantothenate--cysteine ligase CoaBC [Thermomicrobia bacterium]|nr:bifunctional phosphopantothenoylcysteine decarboxylase/phosphopantothenate--cysteine ligase CoaBC [Thermomicrobia bacterium]MCA1723367.1 bifunctional phosphopantothenoylcysteine decarboxylase/phosphopantothenate--cysteine ligase CoaBC [Thermomicrobia bacterium]
MDGAAPTGLSGKHVALGVTGSIAAYKVVELARLCVAAGATVDVLMTEGATRFVTPLTFATLTQRRVWTTPYEPWSESEEGHIAVGRRADCFVVAPATADMLAKLAHGLADDMVCLSALATSAPLVLAPAMNHFMWLHPAVQANVATLQARGARIVGPDEGPLASGFVGMGRLVAMERLFAEVSALLDQRRDLSGRRIVVTAGGTQEPLDPVRYLGNRSSGRMGYAIAAAAVARGAAVTLVSGPTALASPAGATFVPVETAAAMETATRHALAGADALVMSAAVADFRPARMAAHKIKKTPDGAVPAIVLERTPDILVGLRDVPIIKIGFAAETDDLLENARTKLAAKGLAMIVANDAVATIGARDSAATFLYADGRVEEQPEMAKEALAERIIDRVVTLLADEA